MNEAWEEFRTIGYIDQGIVLMTLVTLNDESGKCHPQIRAFIELLGWTKSSGIGVTLAMHLYRRRSAEATKGCGP